MTDYLKILWSTSIFILFSFSMAGQENSSARNVDKWNFNLQFLASMAEDDVSPGASIGASYYLTERLAVGIELSYLVYRTILEEEMYAASLQVKYDLFSAWNSRIFASLLAGVSSASVQDDFSTVLSNPAQVQINPRIGILLPIDQVPQLIISLGYLRQRMDVTIDDGFGNASQIDKTFNRYLLSLGISF